MRIAIAFNWLFFQYYLIIKGVFLQWFVFLFEETKKGNTDEAKKLLGNKGAQLSEMVSIGLPVPKGFTISTDACREYYKQEKKFPEGLEEQVKEKLTALEKNSGKGFGNPFNPLLVSVRSGSYFSMPGMMDTVLNLGLNDDVVNGLEKKIGERAAWDSYRRFIQMFGNVVLQIKHDDFEEILEGVKHAKNVVLDTGLDAKDLREIVSSYKKMVEKECGEEFPHDPWKQLLLAINAVFDSWNNPRAVSYRKINNIPGDFGTGVTVQEMVFGNLNEKSATGVAFTRNPSNGNREFYGEFLVNAQGEDVVAGIRTPQPLHEMEKVMPNSFRELKHVFELLEKHYRDVQDMEFTIENGKLFLLQTRSGKRTAHAAVKIAVDMSMEGLITKEEAILRVNPGQLDQLLHKQLSQKAKERARAVAKGLAASPGAAVGRIVFSADHAVEFAVKNPKEKIILVRKETSPEDIEGMNIAQGILTSTGGLTSHAAVVSRGMGKCCIVGCGEIKVNEKEKFFAVKNDGKEVRVKEGDIISMDGGTGEVFLEKIDLVEPTLSREFGVLMEWADGFRRLGVRTNADTPKDAKTARDFGCQGIGLCRTEHMFFEEHRIKAVREMILAETKEAREKALEKLLPYQRQDFLELFRIMEGLPVKIRLLDPPLHEFLPKEKKDVEELAKEMGVSVERLQQVSDSLHEFNPMLGFRGCRLGIVFPEINEMQVKAIFQAACELVKEGKHVKPEIMIPVVCNASEMRVLRELVDRIAKQEMRDSRIKVEYEVGCMIELPSAALTADKIAEYSDFFSFGTNDLTQTTLGFSRDDAGKFIKEYLERGILDEDPFETIERASVGSLMKIAVEKVRKAKKHCSIGVCGEQGGDPKSIEFAHSIGIDYVSCSPYRVPIARLAAAQAALKKRN